MSLILIILDKLKSTCTVFVRASALIQRVRSREKALLMSFGARYGVVTVLTEKISPTFLTDGRGAFGVCSRIPTLSADSKGQKDHSMTL